VIKDCHSLAIFHVLRAGLRSPQASGSGVMISRLPDGKWSSASAIVVHYELPEGVDVADVVILVNSEDGFKPRLTPGGLLELGLNIAPGPIPQSDAPAASLRTVTRQKDLGFFYAKSKGELLEVDLRYLVIREATAENERFYGVPGVSAREILSGQVSTPSGTSDQLYSTLKALDQRNISLSGLPKPGKCPGDRRIKAPVTRGETDRKLSDDWRGADDDDSSEEDIKASSK
jgi:lipid-binding SYLF domain-containing protein